MVKTDCSTAWVELCRANRGPDFIIAGAMKAATTTLHRVLSSHRKIFLPVGELNFFSSDDVVEHPDRFLLNETIGRWGEVIQSREVALKRYLENFKDARPDQIIGEDSTVYLASEIVPYRLWQAYPRVKLLFILRDPVARCYSHYWHLVRTGVAVHSFERTLKYHPELLVRRSLYKRQLERFFRYFPRQQIKILLFEDFVGNVAERTTEILQFLEVDSECQADFDLQANTGRYPRLPRLQLLWNRICRWYLGFAPKRPLDHGAEPPARHGAPLFALDALIRKLNFAPGDAPNMSTETRQLLEGFFSRENAELGELVESKLERFWPWFMHD